MDVNEVARGDVLAGEADDLPIFEDGLPFANGNKSDFMAQADPAGLEAGNFWWQAGYDGTRICSGVVQMWLRYPRREDAEWLAGIYRGPLLVSVIADKDYVMDAGWHWRQFTIPAGAAGAVCVAVRLGHGQAARLSRSCADPG